MPPDASLWVSRAASPFSAHERRAKAEQFAKSPAISEELDELLARRADLRAQAEAKVAERADQVLLGNCRWSAQLARSFS